MYKKNLYYLFSLLFAGLYIFSTNVFANVGIGSIVPQNITSSPYTTQCSEAPYKYAIYEGQSFSLYHTHTPSNLSSTWEYFGPSNVVTYNYQNVIGNSINGNSIGGKFTDFTYNSNGRLGTSKFGGIGGGIETSLAWEETNSNRAVKPSPNPNRANIVGQAVHILNRKQVSSRGGSYFSMVTKDFNTNIVYTKNADPSSYYGVEEDQKCQNFYIAKCGDGVRDDINKAGGANTNGKQGMQTNDGFVERVFPTTVISEQCDGSDGLTPGYVCNAQCQLVLPPQLADLSVTKTVNNTTPTIGSNVTFTMVLSNAGPYSAGNVTLTDLLPNGYAYISHTTSQGTYNSGNGIWNVGTINVNTTKTLTITAQVKASGNYVNIIEVTTSDKGDPDSTPNNHNPYEDDQASATVSPTVPAPTCTLTATPSSILSGGLSTISRNINGAFVVPTYIYVSPMIPGPRPHLVNTPSGTASAFPNQTGTYTFTMTVMNMNGASSTCSAILNVGTPPPAQADLSVTKTVNNATPTIGSNVTFTMVLSNAGPANAGNVTLTDLLPSGYTYVSHTTSQGTYNSGNGIRNVGTININTTKTLTITAKVKASGNYVNTIEVTTSDKPDPDSTPNNHIPTEDDQASATVTPYIMETPVLTIQKDLILNVVYHSGDQIGFKITFQNTGSGTANQVVLTDILPSSLSYLTSTIFNIPNASLHVNTVGANTVVTYSGFNLTPGAGGYMIITGVLNTNNAYNNRTNYSDIIASNHPLVSDTAQFTVLDIPTNTVIMTKVGNKTDFQPGENIQFTINVTNQGPNPINDLTITDVRPPNPSCIIYSNRSSPNGFTNNANMSWFRPGVLNVGGSVSLIINGTISTNPSCAGSYNNIANLTYYLFGDLKTKTANFPFNVLAGAQCQSLTSLNSTVILIEDGQADATFRCDTSNGVQANIKIDCGNSQILNGFGSSYTATCNYNNNPGTYNVKCYVDNTTNNNCSETIIVDEGMLGYCGNGKREGYEKCDLGGNTSQRNNGIPIHNYLDNQGLDAGSYSNDGYSCKNCAIKKQGYYEAPACNGISTTLSVQKGEILPFRRGLEGNNLVNASSCNNVSNGKILKNSLRCTFKIFNGNDNQQYDGTPTFKVRKKCNVDMRGSSEIFNYFEDHKYDLFYSLQHPFGKYYFIVNDFLEPGSYGEHKLVLDKVEYSYCDGNNAEQGTELDRICEVNFAVTKPYLMQKSLFGVTPKATNDINLDEFYDMKGDKLISTTDLSSIMKVDASDYAGGTKMDKQILDFINKYEKLSIKLLNGNLNYTIDGGSITQIRKVPSQQIYIMVGNGKLTLKQLGSFTKPFTMIIKGMDVIIEGSLKTNGMFVVKGGKISFKEDPNNRCTATQTVQGIFISDLGFGVGDTTLNMANELDKPRCNFGGLNVKGVLIGDNIDVLVKQRRSQLNDRFRANSSDPDKIKIERRNKIFKGASVLIEYSPSLRGALPPGASDFTKILEVYKK